MTLTYPVVGEGSRTFPSTRSAKHLCPVCGLREVTAGQRVVFNAGALLQQGPGLFRASEEMAAFAVFHASAEEGEATLDLADRAAGGQFEIYTCSTACMREFFSRMLDDLEEKLSNNGARSER